MTFCKQQKNTKMGLKKGQTNNRRGRPKGSQNRMTVPMKEWIQGLVSENLDQLKDDLKAMEGRDRWAVVEKLMCYITPKLQSLDTEAQIKIEYIELERLLRNAPDVAIQRIVDKITELQKTSKTVKNE